MNETQLIRRQLALEREHLAAVAQACAQGLQAAARHSAPGSALAPFQQACAAYLACVLSWYAARDRRLWDLAAGLGPEDPRCATVNEILARSGDSDEAQARLAAAGDDAARWPQLVQFLEGPWSARRDALEELLAHDSRVSDWRQIGGIDADGMLEERTRFARVASLLPTGVSLAAPTRAA
jgi:hypothetical protein